MTDYGNRRYYLTVSVPRVVAEKLAESDDPVLRDFGEICMRKIRYLERIDRAKNENVQNNKARSRALGELKDAALRRLGAEAAGPGKAAGWEWYRAEGMDEGMSFSLFVPDRGKGNFRIRLYYRIGGEVGDAGPLTDRQLETITAEEIARRIKEANMRRRLEK